MFDLDKDFDSLKIAHSLNNEWNENIIGHSNHERA